MPSKLIKKLGGLSDNCEAPPLRILLVDDHKVVCHALTFMLASVDGIEVVGIALDGEKALRKAEELSPDVIVLDILMPNLGGIETLRLLKIQQPEITVVILSVTAELEQVYRVLKLGASAYVLKESAGSELVTAIRTAAAGGRYFTPPVCHLLVSDYLRLREQELSTPESSVLSDRELEVLKLFTQGDSTKVIADKLNLSPKTVDTYRYRIKNKLDIKTNAGLVRYAIKEGLITLDDGTG